MAIASGDPVQALINLLQRAAGGLGESESPVTGPYQLRQRSGTQVDTWEPVAQIDTALSLSAFVIDGLVIVGSSHDPKGKYLKTTERIAADTIIGVYTGKMHAQPVNTFHGKHHQIQVAHDGYYLVSQKDKDILSHVNENNEGTDANCAISLVECTVQGEGVGPLYVPCFIALKDIAAQEEITINYGNNFIRGNYNPGKADKWADGTYSDIKKKFNEFLRRKDINENVILSLFSGFEGPFALNDRDGKEKSIQEKIKKENNEFYNRLITR